MPMPVAGPGEARIRTGACAICATDLMMIAGWERTPFPAVAGHEWSGTVDAVGEGVDGALIGHRCVGENVLSDGGEVGFEHPGGYGEYFVTEAGKIHVLPDDFPLCTAALIEPLAVCVRGARRLRIADGGKALIFGDGPIGLLMLLLLRRAGVSDVFMVGGRPARLGLARQLGARGTLNYHETEGDPADEIREAWGGSFGGVVETSGSAAALTCGLEVTGKSGHVLMLGDYGPGKAELALHHFLVNDLELTASNASEGAWDEAVEIAVSQEVPLGRLVTHTVSPSGFEAGIDLTRSGRDGVMRVVIDWEGVADGAGTA